MTRRLSEHERDERDLKILRLLDEGMTQEAVAECMDITRGPIARLLKEIRESEK